MGKKTIQDIAKILTEKNNLSAAEANRFVSEMFAVVLEHLQDDELVKVKGLGTFKIISVEARESVSVRTGERVVIDSHSKVTFTPDTVMKELVNKPFSQFETVVLNDGVEFADMPDEATEEEPAAPVEEPAAPVEEPAAPVEEVVAESDEVTALPFVDEEPEPTEPQFVDDEPQFVDDESNKSEPNDPDEPEASDDDDSRPWRHWLSMATAVVLLMALSAFGGYEYGRRQQPVAVADTVWVRDTVRVAEEPLDSSAVEQAVKEEMKQEEAPAPTSAPVVKEDNQDKPSAEDLIAERYASKDERVRLGAYRIVGTQDEITILPGQTFYSICRAHLGPDMECYIEVYNDLPRNPQLKAGQKLKIPKLKMKKRRK